MELTNEIMQEIKEKRQWLSDSDSLFLCQLIDKVLEQQKEIEQLKKDKLMYAKIATADVKSKPKPKTWFSHRSDR
ncbi:hypothetical protein [Neobacillus sp. YIM B06451]|uniref:hypothetical protein n=1 Tax=Neobacillus sp. YIM B06451 TaxID=3070994 RepID=UPI00292CEB16|nr:hypothetical protein [Neobacillus sp. YIM B06451]